MRSTACARDSGQRRQVQRGRLRTTQHPRTDASEGRSRCGASLLSLLALLVAADRCVALQLQLALQLARWQLARWQLALQLGSSRCISLKP